MNITDEQLVKISRAVLLALTELQLTDEQKVILLDLERLKFKARRFAAVIKGEMTLPKDDEILERARHLLGIANALQGFFPLNRHGGRIWLRHTNKYFPKKPPLSYMLEDGLTGMHKVWVNLDCTQGWD